MIPHPDWLNPVLASLLPGMFLLLWLVFMAYFVWQGRGVFVDEEVAALGRPKRLFLWTLMLLAHTVFGAAFAVLSTVLAILGAQAILSVLGVT